MPRSPTKLLEMPMYNLNSMNNIHKTFQNEKKQMKKSLVYQHRDFPPLIDVEVSNILDASSKNNRVGSNGVINQKSNFYNENNRKKTRSPVLCRSMLSFSIVSEANQKIAPRIISEEPFPTTPQHSTMQITQDPYNFNHKVGSSLSYFGSVDEYHTGRSQRKSPWTKSAERPTPEKDSTLPFDLHFGFPKVFPQGINQNEHTRDSHSFFAYNPTQPAFPSYIYTKPQEHNVYRNLKDSFKNVYPNGYQEVNVQEEEYYEETENDWSKKQQYNNHKKYTKPEAKESPLLKAKYKEFSKELKKQNGYEKAKEFAMNALKTFPKQIHWRIYMDLAELAKRENFLDDARKYFKIVNTIEPNASQGWLEYAKLEEECGRDDECLKLLHLGLSHCTLNESLLIKGIKFHEQHQNLQAARAYLARLRYVPIEKAWKTVLEGALLEARAGNVQIARRVFKYLMKHVPRHGPIYYEAYKLEEKMEEYEKALKIVESGLAANPRYGPLWFAAFHLLEKMSPGNLTEVRKCIEQATKSISRELIWKVYFEAAQIEERAKNFAAARYNYMCSVVHSLKNLRWKVWMAASRTELNANNVSVAKQLLNRALEEVPNKTRAVVLIECARLEEFIGNLDKAREFLKRAKAEAKHEWKVFLESILLEMRAGEFDRAIEEAQSALQIHRRTGRLWAVLIQLMHIKGEDKQLKVLKEAIQEVPKSGEVWCEGARIRLNPLSAEFDLEKAKHHLEFAIRFTPQYGDSFIEYLRYEHLAKGPLMEADAKRIEQLCINADPNYGPLWFHCKNHPLDSTRQVLRNAKEMLIQEMLQYKSIYQRSIIQHQSLGRKTVKESLPRNDPLFATGLPSLNLMYSNAKLKDVESRRKNIFGLSEQIV